MVRPTKDAALREQQLKNLFMHRKRGVRLAAIYLSFSGGTRMRPKDILESPIYRDHGSRNKSVLHSDLLYMEKNHWVKLTKKSHKVLEVELLVKLPEIISRQADLILEQLRSDQEDTSRIVAAIEKKPLSTEDARKFVQGLFIQTEDERLKAVKQLLPVFREPKLWPFVWRDSIERLVVMPLIFYLEILNACESNYPEATALALASTETSLQNALNARPFLEYKRIVDQLRA